MVIAYRKTSKGVVEIETRAHRLSPRVRSTLILVDGKRTLEELRSLVSLGLDESLQALLDGAFVEQVQIERARPIPPAPVREAPKPQAPAEPLPEFMAVRREVLRTVNELLGPVGESIAIKMERVNSAAELQPLLPVAVQLIRTIRGAEAAAAFSARFIAD